MNGKKLSFSRLLRNDRLMIILSIVFAVGLWYFVLSGSTNITTRTITCTLTTANVKNGNIQVIDQQSITVDVEVQGAWSELTRLTADDIRVQLNASDIQSPGSCRIRVQASRNSGANDYEILSTSPSVVTLFCDEWSQGKEFTIESGAVTADAPKITAGGDNCDIGAVSVEETSLPGGILTVQGPLSIVNRITTLTARVPDEMTITDMQTLSGDIVATDSAGAEVDLTYCTLMRYNDDPAFNEDARLVDMTENKLNVLVTVNERRTVNFTYDVKNAPANVDLSQIVTLSTPSVVLEGEKNLLEQYVEQLSLLATLDFDQLTTAERSRAITVTLPEGITVVGTGADAFTVTMRFDWTGYTTKTITWNIGPDVSLSPITFLNLPSDKSVRLLTDSLTVTVFGKRERVAALKASDLFAEVDVSNSSLGTYSVRPTVMDGAVWVYYGDTGYTVYLSME